MDERNEIFTKIINEKPLNVQKISINNLINQFESLEKAGKWNEALEVLESILDVAESQGYQTIFENLLKKYESIRQKINNF